MNDALLRVRITGLQSLHNVTLEPARLTLLVGASGTGKSNLLNAIRMASHLRSGALQRFIEDTGGASTLLHRGRKGTSEFGLEFDFRQIDKTNRYSAKLRLSPEGVLTFTDESIGFQRQRFEKMQVHSLGSGHTESRLREAGKAGDTTARVLNYRLSRVVAYHFYDSLRRSTLKSFARAQDNQFLRSNGSNLAAYLLRLSNSDKPSELLAWQQINEYVRAIVPHVLRLRPTLVPNDPAKVHFAWEAPDGRLVEDMTLSESVLRSIALVTVLAQPTEQRPQFICIDEPDFELKAGEVDVLADLARQGSPYAQVLFATRSPAFVDCFKPEEVVVVERNGDETSLERMNATELEQWAATNLPPT